MKSQTLNLFLNHYLSRFVKTLKIIITNKTQIMHKFHVLFLGLIFLVACDSVSAPTAEEEKTLDQLKKVMYHTAKPLFEPAPEGLTEPKPQNGLPWKIEGDKLDLSMALKSFESNKEVEVKERFGKKYIEIKASLPQGQSINSSYLSAEISGQNLKDKTGKAIKLKKDVQTGTGNSSTGKRVNGKMEIQNINFVTFSAEIENGNDYKEPFKGTLDLTINYKDNFTTAEISKDQVGKTVDFNGNKIEVIKIDGNRAVFNSKTLKASDYSVMNTRDGVQLGVNFEKRKELNLGMSGGSSTATLDKQAYQIFEADPTISEEDFGDKIHDHLLKLIRDPKLQKTKTTVSRQLGPIETLVFYQALAPQTGTLKVNI